jgi:hypothetical protein
MAQSRYNTTTRDAGTRLVMSPFKLSLGVPYGGGATGLSWTKNIENKIGITAIPSAIPNGFELFATAQGDAIRFVGGGAGTETAEFDIKADICVAVGTGTGDCIFTLRTRPYTETDFAQTTVLGNGHAQRSFNTNTVGSISIPRQTITLNYGDLVELSAMPDANFSNVAIPSGGIHIEECC